MTVTLERGGQFTSLPRDYYLSPERFERELEVLRRGQWLYHCHLSELPERGAYRVRELLGESIIVVRGDGDEVRAFFNVCRHRGSELCTAASGRVKQFVCPYHQWRYAIDDGSLLGAPGMADGADFVLADFSLHAAQVDVWRGLVFVCQGTTPIAPISATLEQRVRGLGRVAPERAKIARRATYDIAANWKLILENSVECYHCAGSHPELCLTMDRRAMFAALAEADAEHAGRDPHASDPFLVVVDGGFPLREGAKTMSMDGEYVSRRLLGEFGAGAEPPVPAFGAGFSMIPINTNIYFHADHGRVMTALPVAPDVTRWETQWFVHEDAIEGEDYDPEVVAHVMDATTREDLVLCEAVQRGIASRRYVPGPISVEREPGMRGALEAYFLLMGEDPPGAGE